MPDKEPLMVGLMSGTSMDGVDAALVRRSGSQEKPRLGLIAFLTASYPAWLRKRLLEIAGGRPSTAGEISQLNFLLGGIFAQAAIRVCRRGGVRPDRLAVIGSHGQTIYHQGRLHRLGGKSVASTLQIAEPAVIAERTGARVVASFRNADVAAGGQGAPLVPLADFLLLRDDRLGTVALNLGGIANVTVIPARARADEVLGFDTGPGNMVIDGLVRIFTVGGKTYDAQGRLAARGKVIEALLSRLLSHPFFRERPPKSAGREQFGDEFLLQYFLRRKGVSLSDLLRTATEMTARSIAGALERFVFPEVRIQRLMVSGGGAHNRLLVARLRELVPGVSVCLSDDFGLPVDAKEAMAFALLADRTLHGLPGNLPSVTGARREVVLGTLFEP